MILKYQIPRAPINPGPYPEEYLTYSFVDNKVLYS